MDMIRVVDQPLGGTGGGDLAAGGALVVGNQAELGEAAGSVRGLGGWAAPLLPYCVQPCQWLSHTWHFWVLMAPSLQRLQTCPEQEMLDSHPHAWDRGCSLPPFSFP